MKISQNDITLIKDKINNDFCTDSEIIVFLMQEKGLPLKSAKAYLSIAKAKIAKQLENEKSYLYALHYQQLCSLQSQINNFEIPDLLNEISNELQNENEFSEKAISFHTRKIEKNYALILAIIKEKNALTEKMLSVPQTEVGENYIHQTVVNGSKSNLLLDLSVQLTEVQNKQD